MVKGIKRDKNDGLLQIQAVSHKIFEQSDNFIKLDFTMPMSCSLSPQLVRKVAASVKDHVIEQLAHCSMFIVLLHFQFPRQTKSLKVKKAKSLLKFPERILMVAMVPW